MFIDKSSTTSKGSLDALRNVSNAVVCALRVAMGDRDLRSGDVVDVGEVGLIDDVSLLAAGGYNFVFLVKPQEGLLVQVSIILFGQIPPTKLF